MCARVLVRAHGSPALNKVTEFSLALPTYTVQFSWRASPPPRCWRDSCARVFVWVCGGVLGGGVVCLDRVDVDQCLIGPKGMGTGWRGGGGTLTSASG